MRPASTSAPSTSPRRASRSEDMPTSSGCARRSGSPAPAINGIKKTPATIAAQIRWSILVGARPSDPLVFGIARHSLFYLTVRRVPSRYDDDYTAAYMALGSCLSYAFIYDSTTDWATLLASTRSRSVEADRSSATTSLET